MARPSSTLWPPPATSRWSGRCTGASSLRDDPRCYCVQRAGRHVRQVWRRDDHALVLPYYVADQSRWYPGTPSRRQTPGGAESVLGDADAAGGRACVPTTSSATRCSTCQTMICVKNVVLRDERPTHLWTVLRLHLAGASRSASVPRRCPTTGMHV